MKVIIIILFTFSMNSFAGFGSRAATNVEVIDKIDIQILAGETYYYFKPEDGNWSSSNCPKAGAAYMKHSTQGASAILSVALSAKVAKIPVQFQGVCGNGIDGGTSDSYLYIDFLTLDPI